MMKKYYLYTLCLISAMSVSLVAMEKHHNLDLTNYYKEECEIFSIRRKECADLGKEVTNIIEKDLFLSEGKLQLFQLPLKEIPNVINELFNPFYQPMMHHHGYGHHGHVHDDKPKSLADLCLNGKKNEEGELIVRCSNQASLEENLREPVADRLTEVVNMIRKIEKIEFSANFDIGVNDAFSGFFDIVNLANNTYAETKEELTIQNLQFNTLIKSNFKKDIVEEKSLGKSRFSSNNTMYNSYRTENYSSKPISENDEKIKTLASEITIKQKVAATLKPIADAFEEFKNALRAAGRMS